MTPNSYRNIGNLGSGNTLTLGDAFDCDVDGNGTYDASTERFYVVASDTTSASLIYYINRSMPTTSQWSTVPSPGVVNVYCYHETCDSYDFSNYAARLITYAELRNLGFSEENHKSLSSINFMGENTRYFGKSSSPDYYHVLSRYSPNDPFGRIYIQSNGGYYNVNGTLGTNGSYRPVIVIPLSNISY